MDALHCGVRAGNWTVMPLSTLTATIFPQEKLYQVFSKNVLDSFP